MSISPWRLSRRSSSKPVSADTPPIGARPDCSEFHQRRGQLAVGPEWERLRRGDDLDADMARTGFEVLSYVIGDAVGSAPGHYGIDESVTSSSGEVLVSVAE